MDPDHQGAGHLRRGVRRVADPRRLRAQVARPIPEPLRPQPRGSVRPAPADGRDREVRAQGAVPDPHRGRRPLPDGADDRDPVRDHRARPGPVRTGGEHLRHPGRAVWNRRVDRGAVRVRVCRHLVLRDHARRLGLGIEVLVPGRDARGRAADLLRGLPGPVAGRGDHHRADAVADRDRPRPEGHVVRRSRRSSAS